jgi:ribosomal protein L37E
MSKSENKTENAIDEPQVENFVPERYTLAGIVDERLTWISKIAEEARDHFQIEGVSVDCVQLGRKLNENPVYRISIKTVELPTSIDAHTVYISSTDRYYIGLNRIKLRYPFRSSSDYRANFTIAHELGHILLGHAAIADCEKDETIRQEENIEADEFAGQFLKPESMLLHCSYRWPSKVADHFRVSHTALWQRLNNLKRLDLLGDTEKEKRYVRCCDRCGNIDIDFGFDKFCSICGKEITKDTWGVLPMHYTGPESDKKITIICPKCGANLYHTKQRECPSCGLSRYNTCSNRCFTDIGPSHRHCPQCDSKTLYFEEELLTHWWHAMKTREMIEKPKVKRSMFRIDDFV